MKRLVGVLNVKVQKAMKLKKKDLCRASDPYVKLNLSEDKLPSKKTTVKHKNLNPEWNEEFTLTVRDPETEALEFMVYDWEKVVFFTNSGTEANELALMMARLYTGCQDILSVRNSYHGNAAGTMGATAQSIWKFNVVQSGVHHAMNPDPYRGLFGSDGESYAKDLVTYALINAVARRKLLKKYDKVREPTLIALSYTEVYIL